MNGIVLYKSRYGATRQYADWISADLRLPMIDPERLDDQVLAACNFLLIGTSVYNGELLLKDWLEQHAQRLRNKKLFLFIVCAPSPDVEKHPQIIADNVPKAIRAATGVFFLPGRMIINDTDVDAVRKEHIAGLLGTVRSFTALTAS